VYCANQRDGADKKSQAVLRKVHRSSKYGGLQLIPVSSTKMIEELTDSQKALADYMSELSEEAYFAGWMEGLEYALWKAVVENPFEYGFLQLTEQHIAELTKLSNACGGWIVFDDDSAETFVPIAKWRKIYAKKAKSMD